MDKRTRVSVGQGLVDLAEAERFVVDENCGAVATFTGITRKDNLGKSKQVVALEFEAHVPLAEAVLNQIVERHRKENAELAHVFIHHRIGRVPVGEGNVVIAVSAPHRKSALKGVQDIMDELKALLPVWKKEVFDDGTYRWQENVEFRPS